MEAWGNQGRAVTSLEVVTLVRDCLISIVHICRLKFLPPTILDTICRPGCEATTLPVMSLSEYPTRCGEEVTITTYSNTVSRRSKRSNEATLNEEITARKRVKTLTSTKEFPFFNLPRELRDQIYHHAFGDVTIWYEVATAKPANCDAEAEETIMVLATYGQKRPPVACEFPQWLRCNKQLRQEGLQQFYRQATFTLQAFPEKDIKLAALGLHDKNTPPNSSGPAVVGKCDQPKIRRARKVNIRLYVQRTETLSFERPQTRGLESNQSKVLSLLQTLREYGWKPQVHAFIRPGEWHGTWELCENRFIDAAQVLIGLSGCGVDGNLALECAGFVKHTCRSTREWICEATTTSYRRTRNDRLRNQHL
jgi:hypothetical protein